MWPRTVGSGLARTAPMSHGQTQTRPSSTLLSQRLSSVFLRFPEFLFLATLLAKLSVGAKKNRFTNSARTRLATCGRLRIYTTYDVPVILQAICNDHVCPPGAVSFGELIRSTFACTAQQPVPPRFAPSAGRRPFKNFTACSRKCIAYISLLGL